MQPNILFLTWHDAGRSFGCYGYPAVRTPNVDRLAAEGVRFTNCISACAICSPSRAAIMTGLTCQQNGVMTLTNTVFANRIHPHIPHFAARLRERGYHTALFGVQHECAREHVHQVLRVEEQFHTDPWAQAPLSARAFCDWLPSRRGGRRPFYAQVGLHEAHLGSWLNKTEPAHYPYARDDADLHVPPYLQDTPYGRDTLATLQGYLRRGDHAIGRMLDALDPAGLANDTLVVMCVDHGPGLPRAKTTCYDPGVGVAWLMRWPGVIPAGRAVDALSAHVDVMPTLHGLLDWGRDERWAGYSFAPHARGERPDRAEGPRDAAFSHMVENLRGVRTVSHKFIRNFRPPANFAAVPVAIDENRKSHPGRPPAPDAPLVELYDLRADPNEFTNLADHPDHAPVRDRLDARLWDFLLDEDDFALHEPIRTDWQHRTRADLEAHCARAGRPCPRPVGPLAGRS